MTEIKIAKSRLKNLFDAAPWLKTKMNANSRVPGCQDLTWGDLWFLYQFIKDVK